MGPSGSGKSTLLKILAGILPCTTGRLYYKKDENSVVENISKYDLLKRTKFRRENIGYVFQEYNLFEYLTVEENIKVPILIKNQDPKKKTDDIDEVLKICNIEHRREYKIEQLSGGEKQRVQLAMALVTKPKIIIADEPTGNLDSKNALSIFQLLKNITNNHKTTVLTVTHDLKIKNYCDRSLLIKDGMISNE